MVVSVLTSRILDLVATELDKPELQGVIKNRVITPVINLLFVELYPYIMTISIVICFILFLSIMTFVAFVMTYFKKL